MYKNFLILNLIVLISVGFFSNAKNYAPKVETQESLNLGFKELPKKVEVFDTKNLKVGQILVFDKNHGFLMISKNNDLIIDSSNKGLNIDYYSIPNTLYYDGYSIKTKNNETLWAKDLVSYGSGLTEKFHRNTNETFFTEKKRYLLNKIGRAHV